MPNEDNGGRLNGYRPRFNMDVNFGHLIIASGLVLSAIINYQTTIGDVRVIDQRLVALADKMQQQVAYNSRDIERLERAHQQAISEIKSFLRELALDYQYQERRGRRDQHPQSYGVQPTINPDELDSRLELLDTANARPEGG